MLGCSCVPGAGARCGCARVVTEVSATAAEAARVRRAGRAFGRPESATKRRAGGGIATLSVSVATGRGDGPRAKR